VRPEQSRAQNHGMPQKRTRPLISWHRNDANRVPAVGRTDARVSRRTGAEESAAGAMSSAGEIVLRGPNLLRQDWNDSIASADAFIAGWFRTADVDDREEGFFYVDTVRF